MRHVSAHDPAIRQRRPVQGGRYWQHRTDGVGRQKHQGVCYRILAVRVVVIVDVQFVVR